MLYNFLLVVKDLSSKVVFIVVQLDEKVRYGMV